MASRSRCASPSCMKTLPLSHQVIRENPASRGTETSAEVLVGPPWRRESNAGQLRTSAPIQRQASGHATAVSKRRNNLPSHVAACRSVCVWPLQRFRDRDQPRTARMHPHKPLVKSSCDGTCGASNKPIPVPLDPCVHFMSYSSVMPFHVPLGPCIHLMSYSSIAPRSSFR